MQGNLIIQEFIGFYKCEKPEAITILKWKPACYISEFICYFSTKKIEALNI